MSRRAIVLGDAGAGLVRADPAYHGAVPLLERESELTALAACVADAAHGRGRLALVAGEPGVGKTAIARAACEAHQADVRVMWGNCDALHTPRALGPVLDMARSSDAGLTHLAESGSRYELFAAFISAFTDPGPATLAVIEDLHWADAATLDFLAYAGRRVDRTRAVLLATYRDEGLTDDHPLRVVIGDLATSPAVRRIRLRPLSADAVAELAAATEWDPMEVYRLSGGVPFVVTELLSGAPGDLTTVQDAVLARAALLDASAREALEIAALLPEGADLSTVATAFSEPEASIGVCAAAGLLSYDGRMARFRHELVRQVIEQGVPPIRRVRLHRQILTALVASGTADPATCAHHADGAGDPDAVLRFAPEAARRAVALGAHREAAAQYERALRFTGGVAAAERAGLLDAYSDECMVTDRLTAATDAHTEALSCWREVGDRRGLGDCLRRRALLLRLAARTDVALVAARGAVDVLTEDGDSLELARARATLAQMHVCLSQNAEAIEWGEQAIALARRVGDEATVVHALNTVGTARLCLADEGLELLEESLDRARAAGLDEDVARAYTNLVEYLASRRRHERAHAYLAESLPFCDERGLEAYNQALSAYRADVLMAQGRWDDAVEQAERVLAPGTAEQHRLPPLLILGRVRARRGDPDPTSPLAEALALAERTAEPLSICPVRAARAEVAWLAGDLADCAAEAQAGLEMMRDPGSLWLRGELAYWCWRATGRPVDDDALPEPYALQMDGESHRAAAAWAALDSPYEEADALTDTGEEDSLRQAFAIFDQLGARPRALAVARTLRSLGVKNLPHRARSSTRANPGGLTVRELEVAHLLASHLTNDDIASHLYISPKTVDHHVSAVLRKLGVSSRREAARRVRELVPDDAK